MTNIPSLVVVAATLAAAVLAPRSVSAVEPPNCGTEDTWPDISGFYEVTGTCGGDQYCPQVIELVRDEAAYCRFDIEDGDPSCSLVDVDMDGDVYNPVSYMFCSTGLSCTSSTEELPDGVLQFVDCVWYSDVMAGQSVPCETLVLTPAEGPMPRDNHPCRAATGSTGGDGSTGDSGADETSHGDDPTPPDDEGTSTAGGDDAGTTEDNLTNSDNMGDGASVGSGEDPSGCGCTTAPTGRTLPLWILLGLARRRRPRLGRRP